MKKLVVIALFVFALWSGVGGFFATLEFYKVKPEDLSMALPHIGWLILAVVLVGASLCTSSYALYTSLRNPKNIIQEVIKEVPTLRQVLPSELAQIEKAGALKMLADESDRLESMLRRVFQWIDGNHRTLREKLERPLDETFRNHLGLNWTEAHDRLTTFQDAFKVHRACVAQQAPGLETNLMNTERSALQNLTEKQLGEMLKSHSAALRAEASRLLEGFLR